MFINELKVTGPDSGYTISKKKKKKTQAFVIFSNIVFSHLNQTS